MPIPVPGRRLAVFLGAVGLSFPMMRLLRKIVQRAILVEAIVGVARRFVPASQVPSCGGGGSLKLEFAVKPIVLSRMTTVKHNTVSIDPAEMQMRGADRDRFTVDAGSDQDPVARLCRVDRRLNRRETGKGDPRLRDDECPARLALQVVRGQRQRKQ
jgi:hypothetical protein